MNNLNLVESLENQEIEFQKEEIISIFDFKENTGVIVKESSPGACYPVE